MLIIDIFLRAYRCDKLPHNHNHFTALFLGPPGWASARRELLDFMVQGKINTGRHIDRLGATPSGLTSAHFHHPIFLQARCPSCRPTNSVVSKHWRQL